MKNTENENIVDSATRESLRGVNPFGLRDGEKIVQITPDERRGIVLGLADSGRVYEGHRDTGVWHLIIDC